MILAIDPGWKNSGWVAYNPEKPGRPVMAAAIHPNDLVLVMIASPSVAMQTFNPTPPWSLIAIEGMESHGLPWGAPAIEACWWGGRFEQQALQAGIAVRKVKNVTVRRHLCGRGNVGGPAVRQALVKRFGGDRSTAVGSRVLPGPLYLIPGPGDHKWSALAVAITAAETRAEGVGSIYAARKKRRKKRIRKGAKA